MADDFYDNPVITRLAPVPRWTVSDAEKRPLNLRLLMSGDPRLIGATSPTTDCLGTLADLVKTIPTARANTFFLDTIEDDVVVLDVEPTCPEPITEQLLQFPALYRERSLSGKGHHLVLPLPPAALQRPRAALKPALKDASGWFEVLQRHYVTFSRDVTPTPTQLLSFDAWDTFYAGLADQVPAGEEPAAEIGVVNTEHRLPEHPWNTTLVSELTLQVVRQSLRPLNEFNGDYSRFEFSALGKLLHRLRKLETIHSLELEPGHEAWLIYTALIALVPTRPKHHQYRGDRPLLLDRAALIVGLNNRNTTGD